MNNEKRVLKGEVEIYFKIQNLIFNIRHSFNFLEPYNNQNIKKIKGKLL
ncbi:MAG: hypothetical protein QME58_08985 [Bacteroidota bacterium]|nr:hypothetical protein [Bacteroidota bacterium]